MIEGKGSFREVKFFTVDHELTTGRRQPTYALPYQSGGAISTDLGRANRKYKVNCFVAGDDYLEQADKLIAALETQGPGTLVHPRYGRILVTVGDDVSVRQTSTELRVVRFAFSVTEALSDEPSEPPVNTSTAVQRSAAKVQTTAIAVLADPNRGLRFPSIADWVRDAHLDSIQLVLTQARLANGLISAVTSIPTGIASDIDLLSQELTGIIAVIPRLGSSLLGMFERVSSSVNRIATGLDNLGGQVAEVPADEAPVNRTTGSSGSLTDMIRMYSTLGEAPPVPGDTPARREQRQGQIAIQTTMRAIALSTAAEAALDARYDSSRDARLVRDRLTKALRNLANGDPEPDTQLADTLRDLAATVMAHLSAIAGTLADLTTYETRSTLPACVIAHRLYGDAEYADEVVLMNRVPNPGAVPPQVLEVWR